MTDSTSTEAAPDSAGEAHFDTLIKDLSPPVQEETPAEQEAATEKTEEAAEPDTTRDEKGRFSKDDKPKQESVPHAALHEERERRKELAAKLKEQEERNNRLEERVTRILDVTKAEEADDPLARLEKLEKTVQGKLSDEQEQAQRFAKEQEFVTRYRASANAFMQDKPDFGDAYQYLIEARRNELAKVIKDPAKLMKRLADDERSIVEEAYENELNPAQALYEIALERGFKAKATESEKTTSPAPEKKIEQIEKGVKASKSLGSGGGKAEGDLGLESLSARDLADMSDEEFNRLFGAIEKQATRRR